MFFSFFGAAWLIAGNARYGSRSIAFIVIVAIGAVILFAVSSNRYAKNRGALQAVSGSPGEKRRSRLFNIVNLAQWIAILVVANVLANLHLAQWIVPSAILIVGLHFLPLAGIFSVRSHYITGGVFILIAIAYPFLTRQGPQSPLGCYAVGTVLWLSALYALA
jgi:hypothetical protein